MKISAEERFMRKVVVDDQGCWIWTSTRSRGYGYFWADGKQRVAARWAYEHWVGPIPPGMDVDHYVCHRGSSGCVSPHHVRPETHSANSKNNGHARKTHCKQGHEFSEENTGQRPGGGRACRACQRAANRASYRKRKARQCGSD